MSTMYRDTNIISHLSEELQHRSLGVIVAKTSVNMDRISEA
jgi:hypothetical protein